MSRGGYEGVYLVMRLFVDDGYVYLHPMNSGIINTLVFLLLLLGISPSTFAQHPGDIQNGGFETSFSTTFSMPSWGSWGNGSTPDIQPGQWMVNLRPQEGNTYLGLINREDGTREGISQKLLMPLKAGRCYYFSIALARYADYAGFSLPLSLQVKGKTTSGKVITLVRSPLVSNTKWRIYSLEFTPTSDIQEIILEGSPGPGILIHYRGNILVDAMSSISACIRASL